MIPNLLSKGAFKTVHSNRIYHFAYKIVAILLLLFSIFTIRPVSVDAHAVLTKSLPANGDVLDHTPEQIQLAFNERLEKELFSIDLYDSNGKRISTSIAEMNSKQTEMSLKLPPLKKDVYTVSYRVISADGHPVTGSFIFSIGKNLSPSNGLDDILQHYHSFNPMFWLFRVFFYGSLLGSIGFRFWSILTTYRSRHNETLTLILRRLTWMFPISILLFIAAILQLYNPSSISEGVSLFFTTGTGLSIIILFFLALLSMFVFRKDKVILVISILWIIAVCISKSFMGHAYGNDLRFLAMLLDSIHLLGASVWSTGLFLLLLYKRNKPQEMSSFLPLFSNIAFISIVILTVTGTISTLLFIPKLSYLVKTVWGWMLISKAVLTVIVIIVAIVIRLLMKKKGINRIGRLISIDFGLMMAIVLIASVFTYLNPIPANEPFYWHEMGTIHSTVQINPNNPGENDFKVNIYISETEAIDGLKIKEVKLLLTNLDNPDISPITVPLERIEPFENQFYNYEAKGSYLPFPGKWRVQLRILDSNDDEHVLNNELTLY